MIIHLLLIIFAKPILFFKPAFIIDWWVKLVMIILFIPNFVIQFSQRLNKDVFVEVFTMSIILFFFLFFTFETLLQTSPNKCENSFLCEKPDNYKNPEPHIEFGIFTVFKSAHSTIDYVSIFIFFLLWSSNWNQATIGNHQSTKDSMQHNSNLDEICWINGKLCIKFTCSLIKFEQQELIDPVQDRVENTSKWIKKWHSCRVHQDNPQVCEVLSIHIVTRNLSSGIYCVQIFLHNLLGLNCVHIIFITKNSMWATSI